MAIAWSGVWRSGNDGYYLWANANWANFNAKWQQLNTQNLRLVDIDNYMVRGERRWAGIWRSGSDGHYLFVDADWSRFTAKWSELAAQQLRLSVIKSYESGGKQLYAGVWRAGTDGYYLWNSDWNGFVAKWQQLTAQNLRLVDLDTYVDGGQRKWIGAWRGGTGGHYLWANANWSNFIAKWQELTAQNLRLTVFKSYVVGGTRLYAGVWGPGNDGYYLWSGASWENFVAKWQSLTAQNLRLVRIETWDAGQVPTVRLHAKVLTTPTVSIDTMVTQMRELYESAGIQVQLASTENLNLPALNDCDVGACTIGTTTTEQNQLFANRNNVGTNEVTVYFVRSTIPPTNGCAAYPRGRPGAVVAQGATQWTLAHEVGHVLGLSHVNNNDQLMTGNGTSNITHLPPDLIASEVQTMKASPFTIDS